MTTTADRPAPAALTEQDGWTRVEIPMPVFDSGRRQWQPVGWLSLNKLPKRAQDSIWWDKAKTLWRRAAYNAYLKARVPTGLNRIEVRVQFRFAEENGQEPSNYEPTIKPIIDALQKQKQYRQRTRSGAWRLVVELGVGVIPTDGRKHLRRGPEMPVGDLLGKDNRVPGMVIVYIRPIPEGE
jgi:hypothetical protein